MLFIDTFIKNLTTTYAQYSVEGVNLVTAMLQESISRHFCSQLILDSTNYNRRGNFYKWAIQIKEFKGSVNDTEQGLCAAQGLFIKRMGKNDVMIIFNTPYIEQGTSKRNLEIFSRIYFLGKNHQKIKGLFVKQISKSSAITVERDNTIYAVGERGRELLANNRRTMESLFSPQKQEIIDFINKWAKLSALYKQYELVHKTGILLHGEPGTGKTSFAKAIANYCNRDIYVIDLGVSLETIRRTINMYEDAVILFEDIDCFIKTRDGNITPEEQAKLNFLLGVLDGIYSKNNCIYIATTNYIDRIDKAFRRAGRFDKVIEITALDEVSATEMCKHYKVSPKILTHYTLPINPSFLQLKLLEQCTMKIKQNKTPGICTPITEGKALESIFNPKKRVAVWRDTFSDEEVI